MKIKTYQPMGLEYFKAKCPKADIQWVNMRRKPITLMFANENEEASIDKEMLNLMYVPDPDPGFHGYPKQESTCSFDD